MNAAGWEAGAQSGRIQRHTAEIKLGYGNEEAITMAASLKERAEAHMSDVQKQLENAQGALRDTEAARDRVMKDNREELRDLSGWRHPIEAIRSYLADREALRALEAKVAALEAENASLRSEEGYSRGNQFETPRDEAGRLRIPLDEV